jgi:hypothetical protein
MAKSYDYHRKHEYLANDFIKEGSYRIEKVEDVVDKKINLLYDFYILKQSKTHRFTDPREGEVRRFLTNLGNQHSNVESAEYAMTAALHSVLRGDKTLDQMLNGR